MHTLPVLFWFMAFLSVWCQVEQSRAFPSPYFLLVTYLNVTESLWLSVTAHTVKQGTSNCQENYQVIWKWEWQNFGMILIFSWYSLSHHMEPQGANATQSGKQCYQTLEYSYHITWCNVLEEGNLHNHCYENLITSAKYPHKFSQWCILRLWSSVRWNIM
jgi:hypothetical protein